MTTPRELTLRANGLRFRALAWPEPGPLALLLHATSFCADTWRPLWEAARAACGRPIFAVAFDQRGHGGSQAPPRAGDYVWTQLAEDLSAWLEALLAGDDARTDAWPAPRGGALLVGHSSGATAALAAAGLRPDLVAAVALVEPVLFDAPARSGLDSFAGSRALAERARRRRRTFESPAAAREALAARFPYSAFDPAVLEAYLEGGFAPAEGGGRTLRCAPEREAWMYEGASALDLWPLLAGLRAPVLLVTGERSAVPPAQLERLRAALPQTRVERVGGGTHFVALERPEAVGRAVGRFAAEFADFAGRPASREAP